MRLGGPIFGDRPRDPAQRVRQHQALGYSAAYCPYIADPVERGEFCAAFAEADIVLAEIGAFCLNISDPDLPAQERHIAEIARRLRQADEMGALCAVMHGGSYNNSGCVKAHRDNFSEANIQHNIRVIQRILDEVQPQRTRLVLETESYCLPDSPDLYLRMLQEIDRPGFAVHLDPVNITLSPRRIYNSGEFIRDCFAKLGPHIRSCHAKDARLMDHAVVQITESYAGDGELDYGAYLTELSRLPQEPPLMVEHCSAAQLPLALNHLFETAHGLGLSFRHEELREVGAAD